MINKKAVIIFCVSLVLSFGCGWIVRDTVIEREYQATEKKNADLVEYFEAYDKKMQAEYERYNAPVKTKPSNKPLKADWMD